MALIMTAQCPSQAQTQYILTQAQYHALVHGFKTAMKFDPSEIVVKDSILFAVVAGGSAAIRVDYTALIIQPLTMAFAPDKATIKKMDAIRGEGDVCVSLQNGRYHIQGDHTGLSFKAIAVPGPNALQLPAITWIGTVVTGYAPKDLKAFIGKKTDAVHLAIYNGQLEQVWVEGQDEPYTFTPAMVAGLSSHHPSMVLSSGVAFRHFGKKQSIHVGQAGGAYILKVTNWLDIHAELVVFECLLDGNHTASMVPA